MLFFLSFFMVFISSYMISCICYSKTENVSNKRPALIVYLLLVIFSQVVITFEFLSLFKAINELNVLIINVLFLLGSGFLWFKKGKPVFIPDTKSFFNKVWKALKRDKILLIMAFGFVFMLLSAIVLNILVPVSGGDALTYHLNRASYWMHQGSLNHFVISDDRNLVMPINSEILYLWSLLFFKADYGLFFVSFMGYIAVIFNIYNILEYFNFSQRRILWTIFIMSSFASVIAEISSLETDVLLAGLVLSSINFYLHSLKKQGNTMLVFSAIAYALAMGAKTPAVIAFPGVFVLMSYFSYKELKKDFYKPLLKFSGFLCLTFLLLGSYNYFQNLISFGNPLGSESSRAIHGFRGGIKAFVANYIKYIFMLFDFSGFRYSEYVGQYILDARESILAFLHIPLDLGVEMSDNNIINNRLMNVKVGAGILGFLLFLPSVSTAIILRFFRKNNRKISAVFAFGAMFFVNLCCLSFSIAYMVFSIRFLTFLILISVPVLTLSYFRKNNILKMLILFYVMSYFLVMSVNLSGRQYRDIIRTYLVYPTLSSAREKIRCSLYIGYTGKNSFCFMRDYVTSLPKGSKIAVLPDSSDRMYYLNILNSHGYKVDTLLPENALNYEYNGYDYIFTTKKVITSTNLLNKTKDIITGYKLDKNGNAYYDEDVQRDFSCVYLKNDKNFYITGDKSGKVVASACNFNQEFFAKRGFKVERIYDFKSENRDFENYVTIYKNKNKQN